MIKNRFFKTTQGVAFELALGTTLVNFNTTKEFIDGAAAGDLSAFLVTPGEKYPAKTEWGTAISGADAKKLFFIAVAETATGAAMQTYNVTPMVASTISAQLIAYAAPTFQVTECVKTAGTISTLQDIVFKVIETTPGNSPLPTWDFYESLSGGATAAFAKMITKINLDAENEFFTAEAVSDGIKITSTDSSRHFKLVCVVEPTKANSADLGIIYTSTDTAKAFAGSGTLDQVRELNKEANVRRGIGHYYTNQNSTAEEFGLPEDVITTSGTTTWDLVVLTGLKSEPSPTPLNQHVQKHYLYVAVPAGQGQDIVDMFS